MHQHEINTMHDKTIAMVLRSPKLIISIKGIEQINERCLLGLYKKVTEYSGYIFNMGKTKLIAQNTINPTRFILPQQVKFTLPGHLYTHLGFPECPCCLECHDYGLMIFK